MSVAPHWRSRARLFYLAKLQAKQEEVPPAPSPHPPTATRQKTRRTATLLIDSGFPVRGSARHCADPRGGPDTPPPRRHAGSGAVPVPGPPQPAGNAPHPHRPSAPDYGGLGLRRTLPASPHTHAHPPGAKTTAAAGGAVPPPPLTRRPRRATHLRRPRWEP